MGRSQAENENSLLLDNSGIRKPRGVADSEGAWSGIYFGLLFRSRLEILRRMIK
jgi:hypothetical protein